MGVGSDARSYVISANWDPTDPSFEVLNTETAKGLLRMYAWLLMAHHSNTFRQFHSHYLVITD
jgi:hypothetical protein